MAKCLECNRNAMSDGSNLCFYCNPAISAEDKHLARQRGAIVRNTAPPPLLNAQTFAPINTRQDLKALLNAALLDVVMLDNTVARARAISDLGRTLDGIIIRDEELSNLRKELAELKQIARGGNYLIESEAEEL